MKELGFFGLRDPRASTAAPRVACRCFALVTEELARGWMSLAGAMGGHIGGRPSCSSTFGTDGAAGSRYLPRMADR